MCLHEINTIIQFVKLAWNCVFSSNLKSNAQKCPPPNCHFYYPKIHNCWLNDAISFTFISLYSFYTTLAQFNFKMCLYTTRKTWLGHPTV